MAGGYDGTQEYPAPTDLNSTLRLINDESFVYGGVLPFTSKSHCMVGINETFYLLAGGERGDYSNNGVSTMPRMASGPARETSSSIMSFQSVECTRRMERLG